MIVSCKCKHEQQDALYGQGRRVANATMKGDSQERDVRCTVCSMVQRIGGQAALTKKKK